MSDRLDYVGVRPGCGCVTAWLSADHADEREVREFYAEMAKSGREVRFMSLDDVREKIGSCAHEAGK